jgi:dTDP-4-dehydrorhamnose reductase
MDWFLSQPTSASVKGFSNHFWNGVSTLHFAKIVFGIINSGSYEEGVIHVVPRGFSTKYELISAIATEFGRSDLRINKFETAAPINRVLSTINPGRNLSLWLTGGYNEIPTIKQMVLDYAAWAK